MILSLLASLILCGPAQQISAAESETSSNAALEPLIVRSERVFFARVVERKTLRESAPQTRIPAASVLGLVLEITHPILGGTRGSEVRVALNRPLDLALPWKVGDEALFFLSPVRSVFSFSGNRVDRKVRAWAGENICYRPLKNGVWALSGSEQVSVPLALGRLHMDLPRAGHATPRAKLLRFLDARIAAACPTIWATEISSGVDSWSLRAGPAAKLSSGASIPASEWAALWSAIEEQRYFDLPAEIGRSPHPDSYSRLFTVRTKRHGTYRVRVHVFDASTLDEDDALRDALERSSRLWELARALDKQAPPR